MANNPETLAQLYEVFLYKKKDIIAIQEKLGISEVAMQFTLAHVSIDAWVGLFSLITQFTNTILYGVYNI